MGKMQKQEHPFKRVLKAKGMTNKMIATYLNRGENYVSQILNGSESMTVRNERMLRRLVEKLVSPVVMSEEEAMRLMA